MKVMIVRYQGEKSEEEINKLYDTLKEKIQNYGFIIADQSLQQVLHFDLLFLLPMIVDHLELLLVQIFLLVLYLLLIFVQVIMLML